MVISSVIPTQIDPQRIETYNIRSMLVRNISKIGFRESVRSFLTFCRTYTASIMVHGEMPYEIFKYAICTFEYFTVLCVLTSFPVWLRPCLFLYLFVALSVSFLFSQVFVFSIIFLIVSVIFVTFSYVQFLLIISSFLSI